MRGSRTGFARRHRERTEAPSRPWATPGPEPRRLWRGAAGPAAAPSAASPGPAGGRMVVVGKPADRGAQHRPILVSPGVWSSWTAQLSIMISDFVGCYAENAQGRGGGERGPPKPARAGRDVAQARCRSRRGACSAANRWCPAPSEGRETDAWLTRGFRGVGGASYSRWTVKKCSFFALVGLSIAQS